MASTLDGDAGSRQPVDEGAPGPSQPLRAQASEQRLKRHVRRQQWQEEFPYEWREDDLVTRRDTLRFLVAGSGALFLATSALAVAGSVRSSSAVRMLAVAREGELGPNQWKVFNYPDEYAQGILVNVPDHGLVAYSDVCTHLSCAVLYQAAERRFYCPCHDGVFDAASGQVLAGPPTRPLPLIELSVQGGTVYALREVER